MLSTFAFLSLLSLLYSAPTQAQTLCNGYAQLCGRPYSNITAIGTHDSAFVGSLPQDNQGVSVEAQLDAGIRFLQAQSHKDLLGSLHLCHTSCFERDAGTVESYLAVVKTWLDAHPHEVVTILLVNGDNVPVSMFDDAYAASGLKPYVYTPPTTPLALTAWPTLQDLINAGTRVVAFLDAGADPATTPYILDEFTYFFETPYDTTDPTFPQCAIDRPPNTATAAGRMYIVNHFLDLDLGGIDVPDDGADNTTNAATGVGSIGAQAGLCVGLYGRAPAGILVDYFDQGNVFAAQDALNGV